MTDLELLTQSISKVGKLFRSGKLSPVELTRLILKRIEQLNPTLNAFITVTNEKALAQAKKAEKELRAGKDRGPLHGIPIALKDLVDTTGIKTTCASRILKDNVPTRDAVIARNLEAAGGVLVGKANLLEFAYGIVHPDYGQCNNPWDATRTAGGSSSGSASAVAAGLCYAAVGTDTGGSIRIPASYCGIAGLKPTYGLVPLDGVFPLSWSLDHAGPMARSSADAAVFLAAMCGKPMTARVRLKGMRFGVIQRTSKEVKPEVLKVFDSACRALKEAGAEVREVVVPDLELADASMANVLLPEASAVHARWMNGRAEEYAHYTRMQLELGFAIPAVAYVRAQQFRRHLTQQFLKVLDTVDALISPTVGWVAPHTDPIFFAPPQDPNIPADEGADEGKRTVPHNLTGLPAHSINAGFGAHGLPLGLQIITRPHTDARCLAIGSAIEAVLPGAQIAPPMARG